MMTTPTRRFGCALERGHVCALAVIVVAVICSAVAGQVGPFQPWAPGVGGVATDPSGPLGFTLLVDDDGVPGTPPVAYPVAGTPLAGAQTYALSPSRRTVYALRGGTLGNGPEIVFANLNGVGGVGGASVVHGPFEVRGAFGAGMVLQGPLYYDSVSGPRVAVTVLSDGVEVWAQVFDLDSVGAIGRFRTDLEPGIGTGEFAPAGSHLVIQNGLSDGDLFTEYTLINVCALSADFGVSSTVLADSFQIPPQPVWEVTGAMGGMIDVVATIPGVTVPLFSGSLPDCVTSGMPTGACCETGFGGAPVCTDGVTAAGCSGTFFVGMSCAQVTCLGPEVSLVTSAPAVVAAGDVITYTFTVSNMGSGSATDLVMSAFAPFGSAIASFSAGGQLNFFGDRVTWPIATLGSGQSVQFTMGIETDCDDTLVSYPSNLASVIFAGAAIQFPQTVTTSVQPGGGSGLLIGVASEPVNGVVPVRAGESVRHTLTLTNTGATAVTGVRVPSSGCIGFGNGSSFGGLEDSGGGVFATFGCGAAGGFNWTVTVPPGATRTLVFTTVTDCPQGQFSGGQPRVGLANGSAFSIATGDACEPTVLGPRPPLLSAVYPIEVDISYGGTGPGTVRLNTVPGLFGGPDEVVAVGRSGETAEITLDIFNTFGPDLASVRVEYALSDAFVVAAGGDPFVGVPPPGASWDVGSETVTFEGPLAEGESVSLVLRAELEAPTSGSRDFPSVDIGGGCTAPFSAVDRRQRLVIVPVPPAGVHGYGHTGFEGFVFEPPAALPSSSFPVDAFELLAGVEAGIDGSLYFSDLVLPTYSINPYTLRYLVYPSASAPLGSDPVSGGVLHAVGDAVDIYLPDGTDRRVYDDLSGPAAFEFSDAAVLDDGTAWMLRRSSAGVVRLTPLEIGGGSLPLGPDDFGPAVVVPPVAYAYEAMLGTRLSERLTSVATDGERLFATVVTSFGDPAAVLADYEIAALLEFDSDGVFVGVLEAELGASVVAGLDPLPAPTIVGDAFVRVEAILPGGDVLVDDPSGRYLRVDLANRTGLPFAALSGNERLIDFALFDPTASPCTRADVVGPLGVLGNADTLAVLSLVDSGDLAGDIDGDGAATFLDVVEYLRLRDRCSW